MLNRKQALPTIWASAAALRQKRQNSRTAAFGVSGLVLSHIAADWCMTRKQAGVRAAPCRRRAFHSFGRQLANSDTLARGSEVSS